ncbi:Csu type fimbrial protein [Phyllobacterium bourgognense]|uniref:Spore coat protein U-like protein n=1 Tax=Phyllobacterium bourgognense TaxID=314236 RepID=A0A368Z1Y2_9HYPH|nr:spore coat U domain-containing protein [Phyllobacterium bourgognense]RCW86462.1 spore coat protein U-like protein [Phyllobacterium bourgognense]
MTPRFPIRIACAAVLAASFGLTGSAFAASRTGTLNVKLTIESGCSVYTTNSANSTMDFGTWATLSENLDQSTTFNVSCTDVSTATAKKSVEVSLDGGKNGTVAQRKLVKTGDATKTINYNLYTDNTYATPWGATSGTDTVTKELPATTSTNLAFTVYGRVPVQATPPVGAYTDTVVVTLTAK